MQMFALIRRDARVEDVVMAALDDVDGVNLQVAQVRHRCRRGLGPGAEGFGGVQALGMQPDSAGLDGGEVDEWMPQQESLVTRRILSEEKRYRAHRVDGQE